MRETARKATVAIVMIGVGLLLTSCTKDPLKTRARYLAAVQSYMQRGQFDDAAVAFSNALRYDPHFIDGYYQLAQSYLARRDWNAAYAPLEKAIEVDPSPLDASLNQGRLYLAAREFHKAEEEAALVLKHDSKNVGAYEVLGVALIGEKRPDEALAAFSKVRELLPSDNRNFLNVAFVEVTLAQSFITKRSGPSMDSEIKPSTILLFGVGLLGLGAVLRHWRMLI